MLLQIGPGIIRKRCHFHGKWSNPIRLNANSGGAGDEAGSTNINQIHFLTQNPALLANSDIALTILKHRSTMINMREIYEIRSLKMIEDTQGNKKEHLESDYYGFKQLHTKSTTGQCGLSQSVYP